MRIWQKPISVELLDKVHIDTAVARLGIEFARHPWAEQR